MTGHAIFSATLLALLSAAAARGADTAATAATAVRPPMCAEPARQTDAAGSGPSWTTPQEILSGMKVSGPVLLADSAGGVHLFVVTSADQSSPQRVTYMRRLGEGRWSAPQTLLGDDASSGLYDVTIDDRGWTHLLYRSPSRGRTEYRRVYVPDIGEPQALFRGSVVSDEGSIRATIVAGAGGVLHVLMAGKGHHLWYVRSEDLGRTWSVPQQITGHDRTKEACDFPALAEDGRGRLHAAWSQAYLPKGWPSSGVFYSRSLDGGQTWSPPMKLAGDNYAMINVIARGDGEVHLIWNAVAKNGARMHQWSSDGGETWSPPQRFNPKDGGGYTGQPAMAFDSAGNLHVITSVDGPRSIERVIHFVWDRVAWGEPEVISAGTDSKDSVEWPSLALSEGNRLYVAYESDYGALWASEHRAAAPPIAGRPIPAMPGDVATRWADASLSLRVLVILLALLLLQYLAELGWRGWRRVVR